MTSAKSGYSDSEAGGLQAREAITADIMARTGIDNALLSRVVHAFYDRVRQDALLGPVFDARIQDWPQHLERMVDFWSSVALMTGRYHGTPMQRHAPLPVGFACSRRRWPRPASPWRLRIWWSGRAVLRRALSWGWRFTTASFPDGVKDTSGTVRGRGQQTHDHRQHRVTTLFGISRAGRVYGLCRRS
jgi:hypothetical protein